MGLTSVTVYTSLITSHSEGEVTIFMRHQLEACEAVAHHQNKMSPN